MEKKIPTDLIVRYLSNEATTEEVEQLLNWIATDPAHQKIFSEWMENWTHGLSVPDSFDLQKGLRILNDRVNEHEKDTVNKNSFSWIKIAASVLLLISSTLLILPIPFKGVLNTAEYVEYKTPAGELATIVLQDSSTVTLNENTILRYPVIFSKDKREVILQGEAFFEIKKDSNRPFLVHTGELTTKVLGTSFNIQTLPGIIIVAVSTGKVTVSNSTSNTFILPEEKVTYSDKNKKMIKERANLESVLAWNNRDLIFRDAPLSEAAILLEKKYAIRITFEKETLKKCLITGKFENQPLDKVLEAISYSMGLTYSKSEGRVEFSGHGCDQ